MKYCETPLKGAYTIELEPYQDNRGLFARTFCKKEFQKIGHNKEFVQFNHSATIQKGTIRGMHYQVPPGAEIKLIRCIRGKVYDAIIDIRYQSPTFLKYFAIELDEENMKMIYVPEGFAHGFQTLENNTQLIYHHTQFYNPGHERGIRYNDPAIDIKWPLEPVNITEKDSSYPLIDNNFKGIKI
jgi:dTDP-4-dehydrorhamnose 3,5-epimerase